MKVSILRLRHLLSGAAKYTAVVSLAATALLASCSAQAQTFYIGNSLTIANGAPDGGSPLVILGQYNPTGPLATTAQPLPTGTVTDVKFYGNHYNFTLYALSLVGAGPNANEQTFKVVSSQSFSGTVPSGPNSILITVSGFKVNAGDFVAFCGNGPYYPQSPNDAVNSDATYENSSAPGTSSATPPGGPGTEFTVGVYKDPSAQYEYIDDNFGNQGRTYAIGVDVAVNIPSTAYIGNSLNVLPYSFESGDSIPPLVVLGEYNSVGPSVTATTATTLPSGTVQNVSFYGQNYNFTLYALSYAGTGPNAKEQKFKVVASQTFSGSAESPGVQTISASGFSVNQGDLLAFCGKGPYYINFADDAMNSDATYENASPPLSPPSFTASPPSLGNTYTFGTYTDPSGSYEYIPDVFQNQGRTYAIGVNVSGPPLTFSPGSGFTPQSLQSGTTVTIHGSGFTANSQITFGNGDATCSPLFVSSDGTLIQAQVPRLATTGIVTVNSGGTILSSAQTFIVNSYRNTDGFAFANDCAFQNFVGGYTVGNQDVQLFGSGQAQICFNACIFGCNTCIPNPFDALFIGIVNDFLSTSCASSGFGQCFGFSLASQRLVHGDEPFALNGPTDVQLFPLQPAGNTETVWNLQGPNDQFSSQIANYIHVQHLAQCSAEMLTYYITESAINGGSGSSVGISNAVAAALNAGDHPLITLADTGAPNGGGHCVVAYDLEAAPPDSGDYCFIDVYDNDIPFTTGEDTADGSTHENNVQMSRIALTTGNQWQYAHLGWTGHFNTLVVVPYGIIPVQPTMPLSPSAPVSALTTLLENVVFGGAAQINQISDAFGHTMFNVDGSQNLNPATSVPLATPFAPMFGTNQAGGWFLFGTNGTYTFSVAGTTKGSYSANCLGSVSVLGTPYVARVVDTPTSPLINDNLSLVTGGKGNVFSLTFSTDISSKPLMLQVMALAPDGTIRSAILNITTFSGGAETLEFGDTNFQTVKLKHIGPATTCTVLLTELDNQGNSTVFTSSALNVGTNTALTFNPSDWSALPRAQITMTSTNAGGQQQQTTISSAGPVQLLASGGCSLTLPGYLGVSYAIQSSTNLASTNWMTLGVVTNVTGVIQFTDPTASFVGARFYRIVQQ